MSDVANVHHVFSPCYTPWEIRSVMMYTCKKHPFAHAHTLP